jgi:hypothetical protein
MAKLAIIFSGQPRFLEECYPAIYDNILRPNGMPDVFAHLWWSLEDCAKTYKYGGNGGWEKQRILEDAPEQFKRLYNPKSMVVEPARVWKASHIDYRPSVEYFQPGAIKEGHDPVYRIFNNSISMWYSIYRANILKKEFEWSNNFRYDTVIRTRTDLTCSIPILCSSVDPTLFHYADLSQPPSCVSDWINISSSSNMDIACSVWPQYESLVATYYDGGRIPYANELLLKTILDTNRVGLQKHTWSVGLPRF